MKKFFLYGLWLICSILAISCSNYKTPGNVRELMESEGWTFCKLVSVDYYYDFNEDYKSFIREDGAAHDLFKKDNGDFIQYAITRRNTETVNLTLYDQENDADYFTAEKWINYYIEEGDYTLKADHVRGDGNKFLGIITKHYTGKAIGKEIYLNIQPSVGPSVTIHF